MSQLLIYLNNGLIVHESDKHGPSKIRGEEVKERSELFLQNQAADDRLGMSKMQDTLRKWVNPEKHIINPHNYNYVINEPLFCGTDVDILIFVHSAVDKVESRNLIRSTWGNISEFQGWRVKTVFMLGTSTNISQKSIVSESKTFHDIIQENFIDSYRNLTIKHIMAIKWIKDHCLSPKFIVKVDDDLIVNVFEMVEFVKNVDIFDDGKSIYCSIIENEKPIRNETNKWFVSLEEYPLSSYLTYCGGFGYVVSRRLIGHLYEASLRMTYFWIDDVYVTGFLASRVNATVKDFVKPYTVQKIELRSKKVLFSLMDNRIQEHLWKCLWDEIITNKSYK